MAPPATALLVSERFPPAVGGSAVLFDNIYRRLTDIDTVVLTDARTSPGRDGSDGGCRVIRRRIGGPQWGILHPAGAWSHLRLAADIRRMDVPADAIVHCGRSLPEGVAARLASAAGGPGYVCWAHGEDLASAETSRELTAITRRVCRDALAMFANSANTARVLETAWHVAPERIHIVHPGVDATRFHPGVDGRHIRERFAPNGEMLLLSVGRLQRRKGHDVAIAAVDALRADMPGVRYVIAGDGEERARLEALVLERGLSGHVTFAGEVPDADLPAYYRAASVFLLPNRIEGGDFEGFGIVFLEAAASGIPAIGGRSGGVAEAVQEGVSGFLVGGESADELAAVVRRFATSPYLRQRMGRAARARAVDEFSWDRAAMRVSKIHHDLRASLRLSRRFRLSRRRLSEASEGSSC